MRRASGICSPQLSHSNALGAWAWDLPNCFAKAWSRCICSRSHARSIDLLILAFNTGLQGIAGNFAGRKSGAAADQFMRQVGIGGDADLRPQAGRHGRAVQRVCLRFIAC